jgi:hypothetical protein
MTYQAVQTRRFARQYKKLNDNVAADVDAAVSAVETSPKIGDKKKGDLAALYVYKFRSQDSFTCWDTRSARSLNWYTLRQLDPMKTFTGI